MEQAKCPDSRVLAARARYRQEWRRSDGPRERYLIRWDFTQKGWTVESTIRRVVGEGRDSGLPPGPEHLSTAKEARGRRAWFCTFSFVLIRSPSNWIRGDASKVVTPRSTCHQDWMMIRCNPACLLPVPLRGHRVTCSFPRFDAALQHLDVGKALRPVFRCLTGSARFSGSTSIEDDFLRFWERCQTGLQAG